MSANERQVGGDHYKGAAMEHWDFVIKSGLGYLRGCTSKYVYRWKDKDGLSDLKKAGHYIEKLLDISETDDREKFKYGAAKAAEVTAEFIRCNDIPSDEATILSFLASDWDLGLADSHLRAFITRLEEEGYQEKPSPEAELIGLREMLAKMQETSDENAGFLAKLNADAATMSDKIAEMAATNDKLAAVQAELDALKNDPTAGTFKPVSDETPKAVDPATVADPAAPAKAAHHKKR